MRFVQHFYQLAILKHLYLIYYDPKRLWLPKVKRINKMLIIEAYTKYIRMRKYAGEMVVYKMNLVNPFYNKQLVAKTVLYS